MSFTEDFDFVIEPALPSGWTTTSTGGYQTTSTFWQTSSTNPFSAPNDAYIPEIQSLNGTSSLTGPSIMVDSNGAFLEFKNLYNTSGLQTRVTASLVQTDGKIVFGGLFNSLKQNGTFYLTNLLARVFSNGNIDNTFSCTLDGVVSQIIQRPDGKLYIVGYFSTVNGIPRKGIALLNQDGSLDISFNANSDNNVFCIQIQPDNQIVVGGIFNNIGLLNRIAIARLSPLGNGDPTFDANVTNVITLVASIFLLPLGKMYVAGEFTNMGGQNCGNIARLNTNGSADLTFLALVNNQINVVVERTDNKILIGGTFNFVNGIARTRLALLNSNGSLDLTFNPIIGMAGPTNVRAIAIQPDNKILIAGNFTTVDAISRMFIARLNNGGTLDLTFDALNTNNQVFSLTLDGFSIYAGGTFTQIGGLIRRSFAHLNTSGSADSTFDVGINVLIINGLVLDISINSGPFADIIVAGGSFISNGYNGIINTVDSNNPLAGREAWGGLSAGSRASPTYISSKILLPESAKGLPIVLRWTIAIDDNSRTPVADPGVRIDNVSVQAIPICIHPDMIVTTSKGIMKTVKEVKPGDLLITANPDKHAKVLINYFNPIPHKTLVCFDIGSIKENIPYQPLLITSNHPIKIDGIYHKPKSLITKDVIYKVNKTTNTYTIVTDNGLPIMIHGVEVSTWKINKWKKIHPDKDF